MNKYLLLRDNKQTGPFSAQELAVKGLKPYDLVWLEGKSAAWRYPSEMEELQSFAPAIEEQPYDRFYKRSSTAQEHAISAASQQLGNKLVQQPVQATAKQETTVQSAYTGNVQAVSSQSAAPKTVEAAQPVAQSSSATNTSASTTADSGSTIKTGTGKVYVTLPAGMNASQAFKQNYKQPSVNAQQQTNAQTETEQNIQSRSEVSQQAAKALEDRAAALALSVQQAAEAAKNKANATTDSNTNDVKKTTKTASTKAVSVNDQQASTAVSSGKAASFSTLIGTTSQQEEKAPVIPITRSDRKHRMMMRGIVAACLLLGGIVIGMALTYSKQDTNSQAALDELVLRLQQRDAQQKAEANNNPQTTPEEAATNIRTAEYHEEKPPAPGNEHSAIPVSKPATQPKAPKDQVAKAVMPVQNNNNTSEENESGMKVSQAVVTNKEEPRPVRQANPEITREKLYQLIQVAASQFNIGVLGGISNLHFTLSNNSSFPLDEVELEIKYLGPEKRVVKVQRLLFSDVGAGTQKTLEAPRTSRGVSIDYVVTRIHSRALGTAHAGF